MAGKSRLKVGIDVPWVTSWSEEPVLGVRPCATVDGELALGQAERPGYGRPQYSRNHLRRQRLSVRSMLCPMCGEATSEGDRWTQTGKRVAAGTLRARGLGMAVPPQVSDETVILDAGAIAPLHRGCAERSRDQCPHLIAHASPELSPFPRAWSVAPLMIEAYPRTAPLLVLAKPGPTRSVAVVSFLQLCGITEDLDLDWKRA